MAPLSNSTQGEDFGFSPDEVQGLLASVRGGSGEALGRLMDACRRYLLVVAREELGDQLQGKLGASDVVQETYVIAQQNFPRFEGHSAEQLRAWLRQILLFTVSDAHRNFRGTAKRDVARELSLDATSRPGLSDLLATRQASPSQQAIAREDHERLEAALSRLPDHYLQVIVLRNRDRKSLAEIAQSLSISVEAARKLWVRAVECLQREMCPASGTSDRAS